MTVAEAKEVSRDTLVPFLESIKANRSTNFVSSLAIRHLQDIIRDSNELHTICSCNKLAIQLIKLSE